MTIRKSMKEFHNDHCDNIYWLTFCGEKMSELMRDSKYGDQAAKPENIDDTEIMGAWFKWAFSFIGDEIMKVEENVDYLPDVQVEESSDIAK